MGDRVSEEVIECLTKIGKNTTPFAEIKINSFELAAALELDYWDDIDILGQNRPTSNT